MLSYFDGIFWGIVLILVGVWFLLRRLIPAQIPVFRIIIAALFVYIGIRVLVGGPFGRPGRAAIFSESHLRYAPGWNRDYNIILGRGTVDLTGVSIAGASVRTEVNVVFGSGVLRVDPSQPVRIDMSSAFGTVEAPGGRSVAFGDTVYTSPSYRDGSPALEVRATAVFGRLEVADK